MRLDKYLVENKYFESRQKAIDAIKDGHVLSNGVVIKKASSLDYGEISISDNVLKYVSRAGLKLEKAINHFNLDFAGKNILDVGSSTGGFTEVSILNGANHVYAVDVGKDQLHNSLRLNEKVSLFEETNILDFNYSDKSIDIVVMDVSFVSVKKLLEYLFKINAKTYIILIKPQFETGGLYLERGVVVREDVRQGVIKEISYFIQSLGFKNIKITSSPIRGKNGNKEYIMYVNNQL